MGDPSPVGQAVRRSSADLRSSGHPLQETTEGEKIEATAKQRPPTARPIASFTGGGRNTSSVKWAGEQGCAARVRKAPVKRSAASSGRSDPGTRGKFLSPAVRDRHVYSNLSSSLGTQTESLISGGTATVVKSMQPVDIAYPAFQKYLTDLYSRFGTLVVGRLSETFDHRPERNTRVALSQAIPFVALNKVHCPQTSVSSGAHPTRSPSPAKEMKDCGQSGTEQRQTKQNGPVGCPVRSASCVRGHRPSRRNTVKLCSVKTFVDLSTYSVGRVQIGGKAPEPGPLLLLFLFYSRLHEHLVNDSWRYSRRIGSFFSSPYSLTEGKFTIRDAKKMAFDLLLHKPPFALSMRHVEEVWASVAPRQAHLNHDPFLAALNLAEFIAFFAGLGVLAVSRASIPGVTSYSGKLRLFMRRFSSAREVKNLLLNAYRDTHIPALAKYPLNTKTELPTRDLLLALPQGDVRAIPSVTPDPAAYGWLLEKFVFARAKPVWHRFQGAFLDMGIQRHIPSSEQHDVTQRTYHPAVVDAVAASKKHRFGVQIRNLSHSPVTVQLFLRDLDPVETTIKPKTVIVPGQKVLVTLTVDCSHSPGERFGFLVLRLMAGKELEQVVKIPVYVNIADETILNSGDTTPLPLYSASDTVSALGAQRHVAFTSLIGVKTRLSRPSRDLDSIAASAPAGNSSWGKETEKGNPVQPAGASCAAAPEGRDARGRPRSALGGSPIGESDTSAIAGTYKRRDASTSPSSNSDVSDTSDGTEQAPLKSRRSIRELTTRQCVTVQREQYLQELRNVLPAAVIRKQMTLTPPSRCAKDAPYVFQKTQPRRESATQEKVTPASVQYETACMHESKWHHKHHCSHGLKGVRSHSGDSRTTKKAPCALPSAKRSAAQPSRKSQQLHSLPSSRDQEEAIHRPPHLQRQQRKVPLPVPHNKKSSFRSPQSVDSPRGSSADSPRTSSAESSGCECATNGDRYGIPPVPSDFDVFRGSVQTRKRWPSATHAFDERNASVLSTAPESFSLDGQPQFAEGVSPLSAGRGCTSLRGKSIGCTGGRDETVQRSSCIQESPRSEGRRRFTLRPHNRSRQYQGATLLLQTLQSTDTLVASTSSSNAASARSAKEATAVRCSNISGESFSRTVFAAAEKRLEELRMQGSIYAPIG